MRLLGIDFETTGINPESDQIVEAGTMLWDTELKTPLHVSTIFLETFLPMPPEAAAINGITDPMLKEFGMGRSVYFRWLAGYVVNHKVDYFVAHNAEFDRAFLKHALEWEQIPMPEVPWIDTMTDIPFKKHSESRKLRYIAADHGLAPSRFEHRAIFDVITMMDVLSLYDIKSVLAHRLIPSITVRADVSYADRGLAQAQRFQWNPEKKIWFKRIKETELSNLQNACKFNVIVLKEV